MNTFDEIIQTKAYGDLSPEELELVQELISSEQEYNEMKAFYAGINQLSITTREEVSPAIKSSLNAVFQAKHPGIQQHWSAPVHEAETKHIIPLYNRSWFRAAAVLVVSSGIATIWFTYSENQLSEKKASVQLAKLEKDSLAPETLQTATEKSKGSFKTEELHSADAVVSSGNATPNPSAYSWNVQANASQAATSDESSEKHDQVIPVTPGTSYMYTLSDRSTAATLNSGLAVIKKQPEKKSEAVGNKGFSSFGESKLVKEEKQLEFARAGRDADLNPLKDANSSFGKKAENAELPVITTNDLLSLIEPSF